MQGARPKGKRRENSVSCQSSQTQSLWKKNKTKQVCVEGDIHLKLVGYVQIVNIFLNFCAGWITLWDLQKFL
jgi:hypothetical protein